MKQFVIISSFIFLVACESQTNTTQQEDSVSEQPQKDTVVRQSGQTLADSAHLVFNDINHPDWEIPDSAAWEPFWYKQYKRKNQLVYFVQADFDRNSRTDYAYILRDTSSKYALWAFLNNGNNFSAHKLFDIYRGRGRKLGVGLELLKPGRIYHLGDNTEPDTTTIHAPAIHLVFFETAAKAFYWKDSSFHVLQTGD